MIRKSFFNPFSSLLLALAGLAFLVDVLPQAEGQTGVFAPAVLFLMWLVGGLVRLFYENEAKRSFDRGAQINAQLYNLARRHRAEPPCKSIFGVEGKIVHIR